MKRISYALVLCALIQFSTQDEKSDEFAKCFPGNKLTMADSQLMSAKMIQSRLDFSVTFMKHVLKWSKPNSNVFFSPHSIYQALLLAYFISNGNTENSIKMALKLPMELNKLDVLQLYKMESEFEKIRSFNSSVSYELNNVNRFFHEQTLPIRDCMKSLFADEIYGLNFKENSQVAQQFVNNWVSNQTKYQINDLLSDGDIHEETKLILVNAMYFKGLWQSKFFHENTKKDVFYISGSKSSLVPMMRQKGNFKHLVSERLGCHVIQLPYKGEDVSMFILLTPFVDPNGIELLQKKLTTEIIAELVEPNYLVERSVELGVPKFTVEEKLEDLVPILESMGVGDLFKNTSDLSALTGNDDISFSDVAHKAKISVDEDGTVAAAASAIFTFRSSRPLDPIKFLCNHPFLYFMYDHVSQTVLFMGVYNKPE